ncbi:diacylglycerol kinase [Mycobacterium sp. 852013-50091_SCH5140682]|uniref:thioesterase family protein n=1 Tax=Mycobacterium sp. 852013-50091_SCH5140682 TaxID=1834109 RepID=UPI0007EB3BAD|nr:thioesterase family protein [Mycobacterium sp. 852013-50091_SCH5140682]OBC08960.1 diacylglycerol kinase [Mycobacterium sp. 852013-50091_SCH5140682]
MTLTHTLTSTRPFTDLTTLEPVGAGTYTASVDPIWTIGPKVHGGCMMALCAAAARRALGAEADLQPIAVSANYLHAPEPGDVTLTATVRKRGRQVSVVDVELSQGAVVAVSSAVTLGHLDVADPRHQDPLPLSDMAAEPSADAVHVTPAHPMGQIVHVAQGCDLRIDPSAALFLAGQQGEPINRMWLRPFAQDEADPDTALLFAVMAGDISAPVTMNRGMFGWTPTVQLTTYLRRRPAPGWMRVMASATVIGETLFEEDHLILDAAGQVIVQSRQLAMIPKGH